MAFCPSIYYPSKMVKMNYFTDFLGLIFLFAIWSYLIEIVIDGVGGLKDYFKNLRVWKH